MKFLMTAAALATLIVSPAFAASKHTSHDRPASLAAYGAYAAAHDPDTVVFQGQVIGRDPDANVRLQILRDAGLANE